MYSKKHLHQPIMKKQPSDFEMKGRRFHLDKFSLAGILVAAALTGTLLVTATMFLAGGGSRKSTTAFLCSLASGSTTPQQLQALVHYATSTTVPQQSIKEINLSFNVLKEIAPCNFLVFGLGHDSLMWVALNPGGNTLFLEEDPKWMDKVLNEDPTLRAANVKYSTQLSEADELLSAARKNPDCAPSAVHVRPDSRCPLVLSTLPDEVYDKEWDVIMVDAPKGYFAAAPGRMGAIFTAAAMARARMKPGVTHVYLHDVDRRVEKMYAEEYLCMKNRVASEGRLWHFVIPPSTNVNQRTFC